jgi:hypothetical protein
MPDQIELPDIARFTETGKTVVHRGRTYAILNVPNDEHRADSPFVLRSQRGKYYALTRNRPKPHLMFGVGLYGEGLKCLPGWFSDQSGELVSLG